MCAGSDPESLRWNVQAELVHCRWAMLGAAGIFIPEFLTKIGILNTPFWYTAGEQQYFTDTTTLFIIELILIGWAEGRRWADIIKPGSVNTDPIFPSNKLTGTDVGYISLLLHESRRQRLIHHLPKANTTYSSCAKVPWWPVV